MAGHLLDRPRINRSDVWKIPMVRGSARTSPLDIPIVICIVEKQSAMPSFKLFVKFQLLCNLYPYSLFYKLNYSSVFFQLIGNLSIF